MERNITKRTSRGRPVYFARNWNPRTKTQTSKTFWTLGDARRWRDTQELRLQTGPVRTGPVSGEPEQPGILPALDQVIADLQAIRARIASGEA